MATPSTTRTSVTPAPMNFSTWFGWNGPAKSRFRTISNITRCKTAFRKSNHFAAKAFPSSSAEPPMLRSKLRVSMPTLLRCGANPMRRCAMSTSRVQVAAATHGRPTPRFSLSVRPILADTEEKAWAKAEEILARATALQDKTGYRKPADGHATAGARRLLALADQGERVDKRLWTAIAKLTGANSNTTALVGTPEQVAEVFGDYYDLGISHFLIRGFDPLIDAIEYGRELVPLTRKLVAERQAANRVAAE